MKTSFVVSVLLAVAAARELTKAPSRMPKRHYRTLGRREVPQEHSHEAIIVSVRNSLLLNNPDEIVDPIFALLGAEAASEGQGKIADVDCLQQATADQAFTNAKAAGDIEAMTDALIYRALERNTGSVGLKSVLCTSIQAVNPEVAALQQHQDPASDGAAALNKAITLELAGQIAGIGGDPIRALESGTFAPGQIGDPTGAGNTCNELDDPVGCIFTQNLLVEDATAQEIADAVADIERVDEGVVDNEKDKKKKEKEQEVVEEVVEEVVDENVVTDSPDIVTTDVATTTVEHPVTTTEEATTTTEEAAITTDIATTTTEEAAITTDIATTTTEEAAITTTTDAAEVTTTDAVATECPTATEVTVTVTETVAQATQTVVVDAGKNKAGKGNNRNVVNLQDLLKLLNGNNKGRNQADLLKQLLGNQKGRANAGIGKGVGAGKGRQNQREQEREAEREAEKEVEEVEVVEEPQEVVVEEPAAEQPVAEHPVAVEQPRAKENVRFIRVGQH